MEVFIYILSLILPLLPCLVFPFLLVPIWFIGAKIIYIILWVKLIKYKHDEPKVLWRFIIEWCIGLSYILFVLISNIIHNQQFFYMDSYMSLPDNFFTQLWVYFNLHFSFSVSGYGAHLPWLYVTVGIVFIRMCIRKIKEHYKQTGKLW